MSNDLPLPPNETPSNPTNPKTHDSVLVHTQKLEEFETLISTEDKQDLKREIESYITSHKKELESNNLMTSFTKLLIKINESTQNLKSVTNFGISNFEDTPENTHTMIIGFSKTGKSTLAASIRTMLNDAQQAADLAVTMQIAKLGTYQDLFVFDSPGECLETLLPLFGSYAGGIDTFITYFNPKSEPDKEKQIDNDFITFLKKMKRLCFVISMSSDKSNNQPYQVREYHINGYITGIINALYHMDQQVINGQVKDYKDNASIFEDFVVGKNGKSIVFIATEADLMLKEQLSNKDNSQPKPFHYQSSIETANSFLLPTSKHNTSEIELSFKEYIACYYECDAAKNSATEKDYCLGSGKKTDVEVSNFNRVATSTIERNVGGKMQKLAFNVFYLAHLPHFAYVQDLRRNQDSNKLYKNYTRLDIDNAIINVEGYKAVQARFEAQLKAILGLDKLQYHDILIKVQKSLLYTIFKAPPTLEVNEQGLWTEASYKKLQDIFSSPLNGIWQKLLNLLKNGEYDVDIFAKFLKPFANFLKKLGLIYGKDYYINLLNLLNSLHVMQFDKPISLDSSVALAPPEKYIDINKDVFDTFKINKANKI